MNKPDIYIINIASNSNYIDNDGLSGGDRIAIECTRYWTKYANSLTVISDQYWKEKTLRYFKQEKNLLFESFQIPRFLYRYLPILYPYKIIKSLKFVDKLNIPKNAYVYTCSDIFPDVITSYFLKRKFKDKIQWIPSIYFFASSPFSQQFPYRGFKAKIRGIIYWLTQKICYRLILNSADRLFMCNEIEVSKVINDGFSKNKIYCVYGGVDTNEPKKVSNQKKIYDAVFMARLHPQKGILEAVRAWQEVTKKLKNAQLAVIGSGPEEAKIRKFILNNKLKNNIHLLGFQDGNEKYKILKSAKLFLHTPIYDTGGMAAAEGMAAGLPAIGYNLPGYKYIYPKGLYKVSPTGDINSLAIGILEILKNNKLYEKTKKDALALVKTWGWENKTKEMYDHIIFNKN